MATKFHVNDDGVAGACHAKQKCPFGDLTADHYDSREQAQAAYEQKMEKSADFAKTPLGKLDGKLKSLSARFKSKSQAVSEWISGNIGKSTTLGLVSGAVVSAATFYAASGGQPAGALLGATVGVTAASGAMGFGAIVSDKVSRWLASRREELVYKKIEAETGKNFRDGRVDPEDPWAGLRARQMAMDARYRTNVARESTA